MQALEAAELLESGVALSSLYAHGGVNWATAPRARTHRRASPEGARRVAMLSRRHAGHAPPPSLQHLLYGDQDAGELVAHARNERSSIEDPSRNRNNNRGDASRGGRPGHIRMIQQPANRGAK